VHMFGPVQRDYSLPPPFFFIPGTTEAKLFS
jgi:hypothetical protein